MKFFGLRRRETPNPVHDREKLQRELLLRPEKKTFRQNFKDFFYDKKEKTCLTRTPVNWLSISIYYVIFLLCVFLVFLMSLKITHFIASSNSNRPMYILGDSPIGKTPSLNFFPLTNQSYPLLWLGSEYEEYVRTINKIFEQYSKKNSNFSPSHFGQCGTSPYGYDTQTPCLFFRLNRLLMWKPTPYGKEDTLPPEVPDLVRNLIQTSDTPRIWVSCDGTTSKDKDHILSDFFHFQNVEGFDVSVFPYERQDSFLDPIVAMKLEDSRSRNTLYGFSCFAWGRNMNVYDTKVEVLYYLE